jgi:hypothetical protein
MSVQALTMAFAARGLSPSEKLVLLALSNYADEDLRCWPSQERLAFDTELSARTVWAALKALQGEGIITRLARKRQDGTRSTDVFTLCFSAEGRNKPLANPAKTTRKSCENHSQSLQDQLATVATLTTFEPSIEEPSEEANANARMTPIIARRAFDGFWAAYPRKTAKGAAEKSFSAACKAIGGPDPPGVLMEALRRVIPTWTDAQFIPHPATWLNQRRWEDEPHERPDPNRPPSASNGRMSNADLDRHGAALALARRRGAPLGGAWNPDEGPATAAPLVLVGSSSSAGGRH